MIKEATEIGYRNDFTLGIAYSCASRNQISLVDASRLIVQSKVSTRTRLRFLVSLTWYS